MAKPRRRRARRKRHSRIDHELRPQDREAYLAYLREPRTTNKSAHAWLRERGYDFSESAVARHMRRALAGFEEQREVERFALRLAELSPGDGSGPPFLRGAVLRLDRLILTTTFDFRGTEGRTPAQIRDFADALERLVELRKRLGRLEQSRGADPGPPEAEVSQRVREILNAIPGAN